MPTGALVGLDLPHTNDLISQYTSAKDSGFSFISVDLFHPKLLDFGNNNQSITPSTRSDLAFQKDGKSISSSVIGKISSNIDVDSDIDSIKNSSQKALDQQLSWAAHLCLPVVNIMLRRPYNPNLSRSLVSFVRGDEPMVKVWITIPMSLELIESQTAKSCFSNGDDRLTYPPILEDKRIAPLSTDTSSPWHWWRHLSTTAADITDCMGILLCIPKDLPDKYIIDRWLSEPVVCLLLRTDIFLVNSKGFPVLSKGHQQVVKRFFKLNVQVLVTGACRLDRGYIAYQQYITWLWKNQFTDPPDLYDQQAKGLEDQLQEPLQPLRDNLSSVTYSIFEMDPYKYRAYEEAIYQALQSRTLTPYAEKLQKSDGNCCCQLTSTTCSPRQDDSSKQITQQLSSTLSSSQLPFMQVVMVLGAGRGPLVSATITAAERAGVAVRIYAVEKNPNALFTLQDRLDNEWNGSDVHILSADMRSLNAPEKADIFVSELLGSFGDNELSPECLDGAQPFLKDDGISIPCSYTSYLAPFQSLQFYNEVKKPRDLVSHARVPSALDTPFVVRLLNHRLLAEPQEAFTFVHPKRDLSESNARQVRCTFFVSDDAVLHGLAGYFEAKLFGDVNLSTHPNRHSPQMFSWFPMAFPFDRPILLTAGQQITVYLWRLVSPRHVWYEWALMEPQPTRIHNGSGFAYRIAL